MVTINFKVRDQILTTDCMPRLVVAGSRKHVFAQFDTDAEWQGLALTATFANDVTGVRKSQVLRDGACEVPPEVLDNGNLEVGLEADGLDGYKITTKRMAQAIRVYARGPLVGLSPDELTPELWEQILAMLGNIDDLETVDRSSLVAAINEILGMVTDSGVGKGYVDDQDKKTLASANAYTDKVGPLWIEDDLTCASAPEASDKLITNSDGSPAQILDHQVRMIRFADGSTADSVTLKAGESRWQLARNPWRHSDLKADCPVGEIPVGHTCLVHFDGQYAYWQDCGLRPLVSLAEKQFGWDMMALINGDRQETVLAPEQVPLAEEIEDKLSQAGGVYLYFETYKTTVKLSNFASGETYFRFNSIDLAREFVFNYDKSTKTVSAYKVDYVTPADVVDSTMATCYDEADPEKLAPNIWYVSKDLPRPTGAVGTMIDVQWTHGRVDGLGYDVKLIWGAPDGPDNELILDQTNTADKLTGEYSIPVEGTIRYQLVESSGHLHWQYVSGPVIPRQFSSATAAATAGKAVPGLQLSYIPGQEIYVQLDKGNTAAVARLIPDEGPTLPIYGNGAGARTGTIPAGFIMQLKNAGDHWQLVNTPGAANAAELPAKVPAGLTSAKNVQAILDAIYKAIKDLGVVFDYKGSKPSKSDLPLTGNKTGDVWYVEDESVGYIWLDSGRWEPFGPTIDLSGYVPNTIKINGKPLTGDVNLTAADVQARADTWLPTLQEIGAQPKGDYALKKDVPDTAAELPATVPPDLEAEGNTQAVLEALAKSPGAYYTPTVTQDSPGSADFGYAASKPGMPAVAPKTIILPPGPIGPRGTPGKDGNTFDVLGMYPTAEALQQAHPAGARGDAYAVGTNAKSTIYVWDVDKAAWTDIGPLQVPQSVNNDFANAFKNTVSGEVIAVDDVSPVVHDVGCKVASKNLFDFRIYNKTKTDGGVTYKNNGDGTITLSGRAERDLRFGIFLGQKIRITPPMYVSALSDDKGGAVKLLSRIVTDDGKNDYREVPVGGRLITAAGTYNYLQIEIASGTDLTNPVTIKPQLERGGKETAYTPYVQDLTDVTVGRYGANLAKSEVKPGGYTSSGSYYQFLADYYCTDKIIYPGEKVYLSSSGTMEPAALHEWRADGTYIGRKDNKNGVYELDPAAYQIAAQTKNKAPVTWFNVLAFPADAPGHIACETPDTHDALGDGTVPGIKSKSPITVLVPDTPGVLIDAEYNQNAKQYVDRKIAELQQALLENGG